MAVGNGLASFLAGASEAQTEDDVVQAGLEDGEQVLTGNALEGLSTLEVATELLLENAVDELSLLLLAQLKSVFAFLTTARRLTLGFLGGVTAEPQDRCPAACNVSEPESCQLP